ncbi:hypothetical protein KY289_025700 [Solanum tuberosum]|nr:hypothetical protein KY289_025700 [Solanum tuberosum]
MEQDQLKHELEEMTVRVSSRDAKIAILKVVLLKAQIKRPGTAEVRELRKQNEVFLAKIAAFQEKAIKDNDEANTRLTLIIKFFLSALSPNPNFLISQEITQFLLKKMTGFKRGRGGKGSGLVDDAILKDDLPILERRIQMVKNGISPELDSHLAQFRIYTSSKFIFFISICSEFHLFRMEGRHHVFSVDLLERYATKGRGAITCMATGNDVIVLGTNKGWVIRHDFGVGDFYDIDLSVGRPGEQSIHKVFVDPGGSHCIATVIGSSGADTYYTHAKWTKPRILSKLKGLVVNAVAWNRLHITEASTREIILGTDNGQLYEMAVDVKDKMEKYIKLLFELKELPEAFTGLQMETASVHNGTRFYVMAVTPTRLYSFTGIGSLDAIFASYVDRTVHFMELPGEIPNSELHFFIQQRRAVHFAWLSGAGIYHGDLKFGALHSSPNGDENFVENKALLDYSKFSEGVEGVKPSSLAMSEFHFLLLIGNKVKVVNRISEQVVEELYFDQTPDAVSRGIIGICSDASAGLFYAYDQNSIFQMSVSDEGRDMWKVYLDLKEYAAALASCRDALQRDQVYLVQAEAAFVAKEFLRAASFYAKINYVLSFEEISLKFISIGEQDALRTFLLRKLDNLSKDEKCQITMISTWATELYLDKINRLLLEDDGALDSNNTEYQSLIKEFRAFLSDCKDVLDEATTMKLLESYGRVDELVFFASLKEQYGIVLHHYVQRLPEASL